MGYNTLACFGPVAPSVSLDQADATIRDVSVAMNAEILSGLRSKLCASSSDKSIGYDICITSKKVGVLGGGKGLGSSVEGFTGFSESLSSHCTT